MYCVITDRYTCGDDYFFPHQEDLSYEDFFNYQDLGPPGLEDYKFVISKSSSDGSCFSSGRANYHTSSVVFLLIACSGVIKFVV
jgi:hypothetical protein